MLCTYLTDYTSYFVVCPVNMNVDSLYCFLCSCVILHVHVCVHFMCSVAAAWIQIFLMHSSYAFGLQILSTHYQLYVVITLYVKILSLFDYGCSVLRCSCHPQVLEGVGGAAPPPQHHLQWSLRFRQ